MLLVARSFGMFFQFSSYDLLLQLFFNKINVVENSITYYYVKIVSSFTKIELLYSTNPCLTKPFPLVQGAVLLTVGRSYVGNDVTHSTLLDRACACSYENLPKYRSYRVSNTAPCSSLCASLCADIVIIN